jgi:16S rRNA (guanine527-N7)-methyltransferase
VERSDAQRAPSASELVERLTGPLAALGLSFSQDQADLLARFLALLLPWNARINLTGARSAGEILDRQLADGFALAAHLPDPCLRLVDVGAGAGFLAVACAILQPSVRTTLLEPNGKKHTFLRAVARELPLPQLDPRRERLEEHLARPDFAPYDVAVSSATWAPAEWLERARPLLAPGGTAIAFATRDAEIAGAQRIPYRIGDRERALLLVRAR